MSQKNNRPSGFPHSAGLAICSPRGIGEPHDIAPRGSWHLSCVSICFAEGRSQEPVNRLCGTNARLPHVSASQRISNQSLILHGPLMHVQGWASSAVGNECPAREPYPNDS